MIYDLIVNRRKAKVKSAKKLKKKPVHENKLIKDITSGRSKTGKKYYL